MARATTCLLDGREINVEEALGLRGRRSRGRPYDFRCKECGEPVRPHNAGGRIKAHFEHLTRNPNCRLSDPTP